jgi:hypothetical protein
VVCWIIKTYTQFLILIPKMTCRFIKKKNSFRNIKQFDKQQNILSSTIYLYTPIQLCSFFPLTENQINILRFSKEKLSFILPCRGGGEQKNPLSSIRSKLNLIKYICLHELMCNCVCVCVTVGAE